MYGARSFARSRGGRSFLIQSHKGDRDTNRRASRTDGISFRSGQGDHRRRACGLRSRVLVLYPRRRFQGNASMDKRQSRSLYLGLWGKMRRCRGRALGVAGTLPRWFSGRVNSQTHGRTGWTTEKGSGPRAGSLRRRVFGQCRRPTLPLQDLS